jgi:hypothetical protein
MPGANYRLQSCQEREPQPVCHFCGGTLVSRPLRLTSPPGYLTIKQKEERKCCAWQPAGQPCWRTRGGSCAQKETLSCLRKNSLEKLKYPCNMRSHHYTFDARCLICIKESLVSSENGPCCSHAAFWIIFDALLNINSDPCRMDMH